MGLCGYGRGGAYARFTGRTPEGSSVRIMTSLIAEVKKIPKNAKQSSTGSTSRSSRRERRFEECTTSPSCITGLMKINHSNNSYCCLWQTEVEEARQRDGENRASHRFGRATRSNYGVIKNGCSPATCLRILWPAASFCYTRLCAAQCHIRFLYCTSCVFGSMSHGSSHGVGQGYQTSTTERRRGNISRERSEEKNILSKKLLRF